MVGRLAGKAAVIVGAGRNLGRSVATTFAREGADVVLVARNSRDELESVAQECRSHGAKAEAILCDMSDRDAVKRMTAQALERFGKIDALVQCAKIRPHQRFLEITPEDWRRVMATNLDSFFYLSRAVLPSMIERRSGSIIAIAQTFQSRWPPTYQSHILASKYGILGLVQALAVEFGEYGVRVNAIGVGRMDTVRKREWYPEYPGGEIDRPPDMLRQIPLGRPGRTEEVASAILFLASDESSYVTGASLHVSGGLF